MFAEMMTFEFGCVLLIFKQKRGSIPLIQLLVCVCCVTILMNDKVDLVTSGYTAVYSLVKTDR